MRAVVQRVLSAGVTVEDEVVGRIGPGLCVLVGVTHDDDQRTAARMAEQLLGLRVFEGAEPGGPERSVRDTGGELLVVSQFTLYGDTSRGRRPSWLAAARPEQAEPLVERVVEELRAGAATVATGRFGADMAVELVNDGPFTVILDV